MVSASDWLREHRGHSDHEVVKKPSEADLILFAEIYSGLDPYFLDVIRHPVFRRFPDRCVLYHISDISQTLCRTISPSIEKNHPNVHARRSFCYVVRVHDNPYLDTVRSFDMATKYLFSFVGDPETHPIRSRVLSLRHSQARLDSVVGSAASFMAPCEREPFQKQYLQTILQSQFVLCPRGFGPTSMRLFEVMQMARVPVIISDNWLPVAGLPWNECALFVPEAEIEAIPEILEAQRHRAFTMGLRARELWEQHFSPAQATPNLLKQAKNLLGVPYGPQERFTDALRLLPIRNWRNLLGSLKRMLVYGSASSTVRCLL